MFEQAHGEIALIDSSLPDISLLLRALRQEIDIRLVQPDESGIQAIQNALRSKPLAIHIIGHGGPGTQCLGSDSLDRRTAKHLGTGDYKGELLLYGCRVGSGADGETLIRLLATGAKGSVAAAQGDVDGTLADTWRLKAPSHGRPLKAAPAFEQNIWPHVLAVINGTAGDDTLTGTSNQDVIYGYAGNDIINGKGNSYGGAETLDGGDGSDTITGGYGTDWISGGNGDDIIIGGVGDDQLNGGAGNDIFYLSSH